MSEYYIGLMSGTSMDAMDAVLVDFTPPTPQKIAQLSRPIPPSLKRCLIHLCEQPEITLASLTQADVLVGRLAASTVIELLQQNHLSAQQIIAIGCHGQTIFHRPGGTTPTSIQIGDPNIIAHTTGITTVADFRRRDLAAGGQGAPLVPAFHQALFATAKERRTIVNIGGMANITQLPREPQHVVIGFDTGPGNVLMDRWCATHLGTPYDQDGRWAASGHVNPALLERLLDEPFFAAQPPKSTGRELFNLAWLAERLGATGQHLPPQDVQATLCELTARTITEAITRWAAGTERLLVCGGGSFNVTLRQRLQQLCAFPVETTGEYGFDAAWIEAMAFAWLARETVSGRPGNLPSVTGATEPVTLGAIYPGKLRGELRDATLLTR